MELTITIPDEVATVAQNGDDEQSVRRLLEYIGVELYKAAIITGPQLQELLGLESRFELDGVLKVHGLLFNYTPEQLAREVETIQRLKNSNAG
jgi:hypothetical protein